MSGHRSPTTVAMRRIQSELHDWLLNPPEGCRLESYEPLLCWVVGMTGPDTLNVYTGQHFRLRISFTDRYPLEPPEVAFIPPAPLHPHIYSNGHICLDILYDGRNGGWSPALTMNKICLSIRSMLASNSEARRPPGDTEYVAKTRGRSPKETRWDFDDDTV